MRGPERRPVADRPACPRSPGGSRPRPSPDRSGGAPSRCRCASAAAAAPGCRGSCGSALSRSTTPSSSASVVVGGQADGLAMHPRLLARLALARARRPRSPDRRPRAPTARPGVPRRVAASLRHLGAPPRPGSPWPAPPRRESARASLGAQVHGSRLPDHHDLDLSRILQLVLDPPRDRLATAAAAAPSSIRSGVTTTRTSRPAWITLHFSTPGKPSAISSSRVEPLHVGLERLAPRAGPRPADRVGRLHQHRLGRLVRHVVVVRLDAVDHRRASRRTRAPPRRRARRGCPRCSWVSTLPTSCSRPPRLASATSRCSSAAIIPASQATSFEWS